MPKIEPSDEQIIEANPYMKFRYYCHGCTKNAYLSISVEAGRTVTCPHCGLTQVTVEENYLPL